MDDERLKELGGGGYFKKLLDRILTMSGEQLLQGNGTISHIQAMEKDYLETIKQLDDLSKI